MAKIPDPFRNPTGVVSRVRQAVVGGGAAGNITVPGIELAFDSLISVFSIASAADVLSAADLTSEFSISADDQINNTGGTSTANRVLIVTWYGGRWGETEHVIE